MKVFCACLPPPPTLSSVPFSFGSDMGDHFIVPCGACRQVMREVTARAGTPASPEPRASSPDPSISPPEHPEVQRGGLQPPIPRAGSGLLRWESSSLPPRERVPGGNPLTRPPQGVYSSWELLGAEFGPAAVAPALASLKKKGLFLQKVSSLQSPSRSRLSAPRGHPGTRSPFLGS